MYSLISIDSMERPGFRRAAQGIVGIRSESLICALIGPIAGGAASTANR
jgi:hypothetical protein